MPTGLELRIIAYGILAIVLMGSAGWAGHKLTALHYEAVMAREHDAQHKEVEAAQAQVIAAEAAQRAAENKAETDHEALVKADTDSRNAVLSSVRGLESALHLSSLLAPVGDPARQGGLPAGTGSDPELERTVAGVNDAIEKAVAACQHDSGNYSYILSIAPQNRPAPEN